jgi:4-amino-4-deoxy-L-arabinose transferase-like glycosyltransferase
MESFATNLFESKTAITVLVIIISGLLLLTNLPWQLDDYDQAQQAFESFEMVKKGHWVYQKTPHGVIAQKPPLVAWISAGLYGLTRSWNVAWRLPSLIAAVAILVGLLRAATTAYGRVPGLIAASAFALNLLTLRLATLVRTDMPLALTIFLCGLMIFEKVRTQTPWTNKDRWVFLLLLAASMWIKGPFVYLFVLPAVGLFQWRYRKSKVANAWCGWWPWIGSLALFAIWIVGGLRTFPSFYDEIIAFEFLDRVNPAVHRAQPVYFYLFHLLHKFAPWSILMLGLGAATMRGKWKQVREVIAGIKPEIFWLIVWSLSGFVIMSLVPSKRVDRVFAAVPALCLLLGAQLAAAQRDPRLRGRLNVWTTAALLFAVVFSAGYSAFKVVSGYREHKDALVVFGRAVEREVAAHGWRFEIIRGNRSTGTDGLFLYFEKFQFISTDDAVEKWNSGEINALVTTQDDAAKLVERLEGASISSVRSIPQKNERTPTYVFITRTS